jgi:Fe2+ transport system protein B
MAIKCILGTKYKKVWAEYDELMKKLPDIIVKLSHQEKLLALKLVLNKDDESLIKKITQDAEKLHSSIKAIRRKIQILENHHKNLSQLYCEDKISAYNKAFQVFTEEVQKITQCYRDGLNSKILP